MKCLFCLIAAHLIHHYINVQSSRFAGTKRFQLKVMSRSHLRNDSMSTLVDDLHYPYPSIISSTVNMLNSSFLQSPRVQASTATSRLESLFERVIPSCIIFEIFQYLHTSECPIVSSVCKLFRDHFAADVLWRPRYMIRFQDDLMRQYEGSEAIHSYLPFKSQYLNRLRDPFVGDKVQTSWTGQFVLAQTGPYQGSAWWDCQVIAKNPENTKTPYHVCYLGWQNNWNEWVSRHRLRWHYRPPAPAMILPRSKVEMKIVGRSCEAWLECSVAAVEYPDSAPNLAPLSTNPGMPSAPPVQEPVYVITDAMANTVLRVTAANVRLRSKVPPATSPTQRK